MRRPILTVLAAVSFLFLAGILNLSCPDRTRASGNHPHPDGVSTLWADMRDCWDVYLFLGLGFAALGWTIFLIVQRLWAMMRGGNDVDGAA